MALLPASGRGARTLSRYVLAGLVPLCLFAALVLDRAGESVPAALLSSNPALQAAADLERAAKLELAAAGVKAPAQSQALMGGLPSSAVFQTIKQHEAQAAAPAPASLSQMTDSASRDDLNSYFDSFSAPNSPKLASVQPSAPPAVQPAAAATPDSTTNQLLAAKLAEQDAVIKELKGEVNSFEASMKQKQEEQDQAKAEQRAAKQAMADSRARRSAQQQQQYHEAAQTLVNQQNAAQEQQAIVQQQQMAAQQAAEQQAAQQQQQQQQQQRAEAAGSSQAELERAIGEAVLGHSSAKSATADLAKLLQPHQQAKAARSAYGQRVKRDQFGVPVITKQDQAKLPGVNVAQWADPRVEREVASSVWRKAHPLNAVEGGSQLASFAVPPPAAAPSDCPLCAFNPDCSINLKARGFHRASGLSDNMPAYHGAITPYGGGGAHMSSLHANIAGVSQGEPLWDKLNLGLSDKARAQQLALQSVEGGQQLASVALPPAAAPEPEPEMLCECPRCKLGEEQVGFGDELHSKQQLEDPDLLETIDDELMRLDPAYALRRVDGEATTLGLATLGPNGKANPLSDFNDGPPYSGREAEYTNQVEPKADTVWKSRMQSLQQKSGK